MKHWRIVQAACLVVLLVACGGSSSSSTPLPAERTAENLVSNAVDQGVDGILVYIDDGTRIEQFSAGVRSRVSGEAIAPDHLFKIASIHKLFIAVAVTKLAAENTLQLDDSLGLWLPETVGRIANAENITIRQLAQHRSGVPDFDSAPGFSWQDAHTDIDATLDFVLDMPADFNPDSRFEYSNTNYLLLGKIMDKALGFSHGLYIQQVILDPLQMHNTYLNYQVELEDRLVSGYWQGIDRKDQDYRIPGGSMISTIADIGVFIRALNNGSLLTSEEAAIYPYWPDHAGWLPGYQSIASYFADIDTVIVQFVNTTGGNSEDVSNDTHQALRDISG